MHVVSHTTAWEWLVSRLLTRSVCSVEPREVDAVTLTVLVGAVFLVQGLLMLLAATDALFKVRLYHYEEVRTEGVGVC